jgi:hypothetical protein
MRHPFDRVPRDKRRLVVIGLVTATLAVMAALKAIDASLETAPTPHGIVSFEVCAFDQSCARAVDAYRPVRLAAGMSLGLDYLFMPLYAAAIAASLVFVAGRRGPRARSIAALLAWGSFVAALFDAIENAALYGMLAADRATPALAWTAAIFATAKFALIFAALVGLLVVPLASRRV